MNFGILKAPAAWKRGPLIADDANTVAHVYWRNGALVDSIGNTWSMQGTVPQVAGNGKTSPGAGPCTSANYYSLGSGNDVLDFAADFSVCLVFAGSSSIGVPIINASPNTAGWSVYWLAGAGLTLATYNGSFLGCTTANAVPSSGLCVACVGRASGTKSSKLNLGTIATQAGGAIVAGTSGVAKLGSDGTNGCPILYEAWFSTTTPTDALFTSMMQSIKSKTGISAW